MNKETSLNNLLYIHEHLSCRNYLEKVENGFKYIEFEQDAVFWKRRLCGSYNYSYLKENVYINYNQFKIVNYRQNQSFCYPRWPQ